MAREGASDHPFWTLREAQARRLEGDPARGLAFLEDSIKKSEFVPPPFLFVAANLALQQGSSPSHAAISSGCVRNCWIPSPPSTISASVRQATPLCCNGWATRNERSESWTRSEVHEGRTRLGLRGYAIGDVEALALLGRRDEALAHLREAVDAGWRSTWRRNGWHLADNPYVAGLREDARFRAIVAEVDADIARMRERAAQAEASGDWQPLLKLAAQGEGRVLPASAR
jgi:hypothetical protein